MTQDQKKTLDRLVELDGNEVMMHCHDGRIINIRDSEDITYTIENMACDDWTIADNCGVKGEI